MADSWCCTCHCCLPEPSSWVYRSTPVLPQSLPRAQVLVAQRMAAGHGYIVHGVRARDVGQLPALQPAAVVTVHLHTRTWFCGAIFRLPQLQSLRVPAAPQANASAAPPCHRGLGFRVVHLPPALGLPGAIPRVQAAGNRLKRCHAPRVSC